MIGASLVMGLLLLGIDNLTRDLFVEARSLAFRALVLGAIVCVGAATFFAITFATGVLQPSQMRRVLRRNR